MPEVGKPANVNVQNVYAGKVSSDPLLLLAAHGCQILIALQAETALRMCAAALCSNVTDRQKSQTAASALSHTIRAANSACVLTHQPAPAHVFLCRPPPLPPVDPARH